MQRYVFSFINIVYYKYLRIIDNISSSNKKRTQILVSFCLAERKGFEPLDRKCGQRFSRPPRSTTPASLRFSVCKGTTYFSIAKIYFIFFYLISCNTLLFCVFIFTPFSGKELIFSLFFSQQSVFSKISTTKYEKKDSTNMLSFLFAIIQTIKKFISSRN